jgi:ubiquinone/menaquinone biosynthesis C-methylase UbiE
MENSKAASVTFDRAADFYDATRGLPPEATERICEMMSRAIGDMNARVLEVGVGTGRIAFPLVQRGHRVTGVDLSLPMMRKFQEKVAGHADLAARLSLVRVEATRLPFASASFDAVIEVHVLHLIPDWRVALDEMKRVLRRGGLLLRGHAGGELKPEEASWSPWAETRTLWRDILREMGHPIDWVGTKSVADLLAAMREGAQEVTQLPPIKWSITDSFQRAYGFLEGRFFSDTWRVPDEVFTKSIHRLHEELVRKHGDINQPHEVEQSFQIFAARF